MSVQGDVGAPGVRPGAPAGGAWGEAAVVGLTVEPGAGGSPGQGETIGTGGTETDGEPEADGKPEADGEPEADGQADAPGDPAAADAGGVANVHSGPRSVAHAAKDTANTPMSSSRRPVEEDVIREVG